MKQLIIFLSSFLLTTFAAAAFEPSDTLLFTYKLHGQTRRFKVTFNNLPHDGGTVMNWSIVRNLKLWEGSYTMTPQAVKSATELSFIMPEDRNHITLPHNATFGIISSDALKSLQNNGKMTYNSMEYIVIEKEQSTFGQLFHVREPVEGEEMWIFDNDKCPLITRMTDNPLEINWTVTLLNRE